MRVKALFREYDYPVNVVSGIQGSYTLTGTGTLFTELKVGTILEVEGFGFIGKVASVQSDTSLTLDRPVSELFTDKVFWQDWSLYLVALSGSSRKTESKQVGKTGVQVYDNISLGFYHVQYVQIEGQNIYNPVAAAFEGDLDSKKRYVIRLQAAKRGQKFVPLVSNTYAQIIDNIGNYLAAAVRGDDTETFFEGMIDFETLKFPVLKDSEGEKIPSVTFDVIDKLSAVTLLDNQIKQRADLADASARLGVAYTVGFGIIKIASNVGTIYALPTWKREFSGNQAVKGAAVAHPETILKKGETFKHPNSEKEAKLYFVIDCGLTNVNGVDTTWVKVSSPDEIQFDPANWYQFVPQMFYHSAAYYGYAEICNYVIDQYGRSIVKSFNSAEMINALISQFWGDIAGNLGMGAVIPLDYYDQMIDSKPFGKRPFEALQYMVDSNNSYLLINRLGKAQLHKRKDFNSIPSQNDKTIPELYLGDIQKKHVWEKLVDCVEINVRSWIKDDSGKYIDGIGTAYLDKIIEPRNKLSKDVFIDIATLSEYGMSIDPSGNLVDQSLPNAKQYEILNHYASIIAEEYLDFYGLRHSSYEMKLQTITWDMLSWDLTSIFSYNNKRFFITDLEFDFVESTCSIKLVSIDGYSYNKSNILIAKNPETEAKNSATKIYNNYGGSAVILSPYWDGSSNGLDPALGRKSLELSADNAPEFGSIRLISKVLTGNYTLTTKENVVLCDCTSADITLTLPAVLANKNIEYLIQKTDSSANKVIISGTVSGLTNHSLLYQRETIRIKSDGTAWIFLSRPSVRTYAGSPVGQLVPQYSGEEVYNTTDKQWFKATGSANTDWLPLTLRTSDDIILEPGVTGGTAGEVIIKQPGTAKADNKYLAFWHDGVNAFLKAFTDAFIIWNKIVTRHSTDTNGTKQVEAYHDGTNGHVTSKSGELQTDNVNINVGTGKYKGDYAEINKTVKIKGGQGGTNQFQLEGSGSTTFYHIGNFSGNTYSSNNYYYDGDHKSDDASKKSVELQYTENGFIFSFMPAGSPGSRQKILEILSDYLIGEGTLELDSLKNLISVAKKTAYNVDFGTTHSTVAYGDHKHDEVYAKLSTPSIITVQTASQIVNQSGTYKLQIKTRTVTIGSDGTITMGDESAWTDAGANWT